MNNGFDTVNLLQKTFLLAFYLILGLVLGRLQTVWNTLKLRQLLGGLDPGDVEPQYR